MILSDRSNHPPIQGNKNVGCILLARLDSVRFPSKVLCELSEIKIIDLILGRLRRINRNCTILLATSSDLSDNPLESWARENGVFLFRGSKSNVLLRFIEAAEMYSLDYAFRVNCDSPFPEIELFESAIDLIEGSSHSLITTKNTGLPLGVGIELININFLRSIMTTAVEKDREHITSIFYCGKFVFHKMKHNLPPFADLRLVVDYPEDIQKIEKLIRVGRNTSIDSWTYRNLAEKF